MKNSAKHYQKPFPKMDFFSMQTNTSLTTQNLVKMLKINTVSSECNLVDENKNLNNDNNLPASFNILKEKSSITKGSIEDRTIKLNNYTNKVKKSISMESHKTIMETSNQILEINDLQQSNFSRFSLSKKKARKGKIKSIDTSASNMQNQIKSKTENKVNSSTSKNPKNQNHENNIDNLNFDTFKKFSEKKSNCSNDNKNNNLSCIMGSTQSKGKKSEGEYSSKISNSPILSKISLKHKKLKVNTETKPSEISTCYQDLHSLNKHQSKKISLKQNSKYLKNNFTPIDESSSSKQNSEDISKGNKNSNEIINKLNYKSIGPICNVITSEITSACSPVSYKFVFSRDSDKTTVDSLFFSKDATTASFPQDNEIYSKMFASPIWMRSPHPEEIPFPNTLPSKTLSISKTYSDERSLLDSGLQSVRAMAG